MAPYVSEIFNVTESNFETLALDTFRYQFNHVTLYREYCEALKRNPTNISSLFQIPFLPVSFFKSHTIISDEKTSETIYESSTTTGSTPSKHHVADVRVYEESFLKAFELFYGSPSDYVILALLPSYLERENSSLIHMAKKLMLLTRNEKSGFFLNDFDTLNETLIQLRDKKQKTILVGVTYALLDFTEQYKIYFPDLIVMETGGMKGRRKDITRSEVHEKINAAFATTSVHSEYGMTELLSQAYSRGNGSFQTPPWMRIIIRDIQNPLSIVPAHQIGAINIIDLANIYSCSFIATDDLGRLNSMNEFEVLGRMDNSEVRGCNLMYV